ncbi:MAG: type II secretion system F family protein [Anaerolineae bacterium]|nr:type II secretion system F family protein [Anaerolineae bacterium]
MGPLTFGFLVMIAIMTFFIALWRMARTEDPIEARLRQYSGLTKNLPANPDTSPYATLRRPALTGINRIMQGFGLGPILAREIARADLPFTVAEFTMLILGAAFFGFLIGFARGGPLIGLALAALLGYAPIFYVGVKRQRRQNAFTEQLPDVLTLLVGALRAGYGISQSLHVVIEQLPPPASAEFARVVRAIGLGLSAQQALSDMADRIGTDDADLVVTAINVQYEMGGNLAQTLEVIGETVRDRIRIKREIFVLTAQQRLSGYVLAVLPVVLAVLLFLMRPEYMSRLFEPGWVRLLPVAAVIMMVAGFLVIRRILDIEV